MFWQSYLMIEKEILEIAKFVYFDDEKHDHNLNVYSPYIADLLVKVCVEIEAISKEIYLELGGDKQADDNTLMFDTDCLKLIDIKYKTSQKLVLVSCPLFNITKKENMMFKPLKEAHKRGGTRWERAYQAVKHNRYNSLREGTILNLLKATGALYLLNIYCKYEKERIILKYAEIDYFNYSLGSSIFAVKKPDKSYVSKIDNQVTSNQLISIDSPFILKFTDSMYKKIIETWKKQDEEISNFLISQPEIREEKFQQTLKKNIISNIFDFFSLLYTYRFNKRIPNSLPFNKRKEALINSPEWRSDLREKNEFLKEEDITSENIQSQIDKIGKLSGLKKFSDFHKVQANKVFYEGECELVIDNGNIKYVL